MGKTLTPGLRVGLLGGSFNPAHAGHLHISAEALTRLELDEVWWLVSPQNPLKSPAGMAPLDKRLEKAREVAKHPAIRVTDLETQLGTSFTADTLSELKAMGPDLNFVWIMGADNFAQLPEWRNWTQIMENVPIAVMARPEFEDAALTGQAAKKFKESRILAADAPDLAGHMTPAWVFLPIPLHPASATQIRKDGQW